MSEICIKAGGVFVILLFVFHLFFWKIFQWKTELRKLNKFNKRVLPILNLCLMFVFGIVAFISLSYTTNMIETDLGHVLLLLIGLFWLFRAILQVTYFTLKTVKSTLFFLIFCIGAFLYLYPCFIILS